MLLTILTFIIVLGLLVFVHELGHFIAARSMGVKAEEFGFGYPPRIFGWKKVNGKRKFFFGRKEVESEDTIYSMNWIPLGGFVKIKGEDGDSKEDKDSFPSKKIWQRGIMLSAGVVMNVVLCVVLLSVGYFIGLPRILDQQVKDLNVKNPKVQIISILENSPASEAGFELGDTILGVNDQRISAKEDFQKYADEKVGQEIEIKFRRIDQEMTAKVTPKSIDEFENLPFDAELLKDRKALIGVSLVETGIVSYPWYAAIWEGLKITISLIWQIVYVLFLLIKNLIIRQTLITEVSGPVGIAVLTGQVVRLGFIYVLQFAAMLSLNLAIINFLPIPALDGGRILFLVIEKIRGKAIKQKVEALAHNIGFIALMILVLLVTCHDIIKFGGQIWGAVRNVVGV